jgi:hypothetical protein
MRKNHIVRISGWLALHVWELPLSLRTGPCPVLEEPKPRPHEVEAERELFTDNLLQ